ncbi:MAG: GNAT family N-acetyltransferase, partial [Beijerinckiaceae bacterium]
DNDEAVRSTRGLSIVAEIDGVMAGYLCLAVESIGSFVREDLRRVAFVRELVVAERFRRTGIGQKLLQEAEDYAVSMGMKRLMLGVLARNAAAQNAYLKFGLRPYAIEMMKELD